ncbi:ankyrin repeat and MYND domain-containing protein 2 isoform X2 [Hydra vulgaris]|uniref:Ankyrin repeat and MYND domain-containing protein 2 isoform X2 n=1 Tax=Hydra vulgaris TaxID=6087 RepID=A0ABM4DI98_HYDVU
MKAEKTNDHLSEIEKAFFLNVKNGNLSAVKELISQVNVDVTEEDGMTALMYASYKGNEEMIEYLLLHGANVNSDTHKDLYTPLMFATLSGSADSVRLLLEAGAKSDTINKINRTASQLGAFTGRHDCVSIINNFVQLEDIEYYTRKQGFDEFILKEHLVKPLHKYLITPNLNPVKLVLYVKENTVLLADYTSVDKVLTMFCQKSFKNVNEVLAIKTHILNFFLKKCYLWDQGTEGKNGINGLLKYLVKGRSSDGFAIGTETLLRDSLKSFPYASSNVFQQLIKILSSVPVGGSPSAITAITQSINGLQSADFTECCSCCGNRRSFNKCSSCKMVRYCNQSCQKLHWGTHKKFCERLKEEFLLLQQQKVVDKECEENRVLQKNKELQTQENVET